jgi:acetylornithine deacetylase
MYCARNILMRRLLMVSREIPETAPMETYASETLLARLISFDTTSRLSNLGLIHFIRDYLAQHGVDSQVLDDRSHTKATLFASIGPTDRPGFLLAGHTDVVPVDGQAWTTDPFQLHRRDGRLFGRGSADMKGFIACVLAAVPQFVSLSLHTPIHLAFTCDEELGCIGLRELLEDSGSLPVTAKMGIVGEPTSMRLVAEHKGKIAMRVEVRGQAGHSSNPSTGVNAVEYAAELIAFIRRLNQEKRVLGPFDTEYETPHTTLHVGSVHGGTVLNVIPAECSFEFEIRYLPRDPAQPILDLIHRFAADELEPAMKRVNPACGITFREKFAYPGLSIAPDAEVVAFVGSLLDPEAAPAKIAFGTEAGLYQQRCGIPAVVCGPGDIAVAHRADEYIDRSQLAACDQFLGRLAGALSR